MNNDYVVKKDLMQVVTNTHLIESFCNKTVFITGSTGLIGSLIINVLLLANEKKNLNITILALARSKQKVYDTFGDFVNHPKIKFIYSDIINLQEIKEPVHYIIHGASITDSKKFVVNPIETIDTALIGSKRILELAKQKNIISMVYLSSLEVYGLPKKDDYEITESDYGYLDIINPRSSYSESKRMVECMCSAYASEYHVPVKIVRLAQTFGAGVDYNDNRVFAQFARSVIEKTDIILHTEGKTIRNYCYTTDAIRAIIYTLLLGKNGEAYNVANSNTSISIKDMASLLVNRYKESGIKIVYEINDPMKYGYNPVVHINLCTDKLIKLGWKAEIDFPEMFDRLIESMSIRRNS